MGNYVLSERAARALIPLIRGKAASSSPGYAPAAVSLDAFPAPFTVRWSQSEDNGSGAWVIWLPDLAKLVQLDGAYLTLTGVTAATVLPTGWYTINDDDGEATEVYCNVHMPTGSGSPSANISVDADTATTGESVIPVLVARMTTSTAGAKLVKQFVDSALILAGGGGEMPASGVVVMSVDYVDANTDPDFEDYPFNIRARRGNLTTVNGAHTVVEDTSLKQFIDTVPLSSYFEP
jgi:hypothetical protein